MPGLELPRAPKPSPVHTHVWRLSVYQSILPCPLACLWLVRGREWIQESIKIESCFNSSCLATIQAALTWGINSRANSLAYLALAPHTLDRIKSWFNSFSIRFCGNGGTGGLPYIAGMTSTALFGDIEGVNGYCSQLGSMAYGTSPPLGWN